MEMDLHGGGGLHGGICMEGILPGRGSCMEEADLIPPRYIQPAVDAHPTGMYSCYVNISYHVNLCLFLY